MIKKLTSRTEFAALAGVSAAAVTNACKSALLPAVDGKRIDAAHPAAVAYIEKQQLAQTPPTAAGIDSRYDEAVEYCTQTGRWSTTNIQRGLRVGYNRALRMMKTIQAAGLVPDNPVPVPTPPEQPKAPHVRGTAAAKEKRKAASAPTPEIDHQIPDNISEFAEWTLRDLVNKFGTDVAFLDWLRATKTIEEVEAKRLSNAKDRGQLVSRSVVQTGIIDTLDGAFTRMLTDGAKTISTRAHAQVQAGAEQQELEEFVAKQLSTFIKPTKAKIARVLRNA